MINEGLEYKDMIGMIKPTIHIDEFASKMGSDDEIVVVSFYVRDQQAALDLVNWLEKGYDFVLDADMSPGEVKPNRYLVYAELKRRSYTGENIAQMINDLDTLTEYAGDDWSMHYKKGDYSWSVESYNKLVPLSPKQYRQEKESELNTIRSASGIDTKNVFEPDADLKTLQSAAGII